MAALSSYQRPPSSSTTVDIPIPKSNLNGGKNIGGRGHVSRLVRRLREMRKQLVLCDAVLQCKVNNPLDPRDGTFFQVRAHRLILAASSPYFRAIFSVGMAESAAEAPVTLEDVEPDTLVSIIDYAYTGAVEITPDNVLQMLVCSNYIDMGGLLKDCCDYLNETIDEDSVLLILQSVIGFSTKPACVALYNRCCAYLARHLEHCLESDALFEISADTLAAVFELDGLHAHSEELLLDAAIRWLTHNSSSSSSRSSSSSSSSNGNDNSSERTNSSRSSSNAATPPAESSSANEGGGDEGAGEEERQQRLACAPRLLRALRLPLLPSSALLHKLKNNPIFCWSAECGSMIDRALLGHTRHQRSQARGEEQQQQQQQQQQQGGAEAMALDSHEGGGGTEGVGEGEDIEERRRALEQELMLLHRPRVGMQGLFVLGGRMYGGQKRGGRDQSAVMFLPPATTRSAAAAAAAPPPPKDVGEDAAAAAAAGVAAWTPLRRMKPWRTHFAAAQCGGMLYVCGGVASSAPRVSLRSVHEYDAQCNSWTPLPPMKLRRRAHGCCSLNGLVYAVGGDSGGVAMGSVEVFDPSKQEWFHAPPLHTPRSHHGVAVLGGYIYAVGGFGKMQNWLDSVERLRPVLLQPGCEQWVEVEGAAGAGRDGGSGGGGRGGGTASEQKHHQAGRGRLRVGGVWEPVGRLLNGGCADHGVAALGRYLYAAGGQGPGGGALGTVQRYCPAHDMWLPCPALGDGRTGLALAGMEGRLYAVGGHNDAGRYTGTIEEWEPHGLGRGLELGLGLGIGGELGKESVVEGWREEVGRKPREGGEGRGEEEGCVEDTLEGEEEEEADGVLRPNPRDDPGGCCARLVGAVGGEGDASKLSVVEAEHGGQPSAGGAGEPGGALAALLAAGAAARPGTPAALAAAAVGQLHLPRGRRKDGEEEGAGISEADAAVMKAALFPIPGNWRVSVYGVASSRSFHCVVAGLRRNDLWRVEMGDIEATPEAGDAGKKTEVGGRGLVLRGNARGADEEGAGLRDGEGNEGKGEPVGVDDYEYVYEREGAEWEGAAWDDWGTGWEMHGDEEEEGWGESKGGYEAAGEGVTEKSEQDEDGKDEEGGGDETQALLGRVSGGRAHHTNPEAPRTPREPGEVGSNLHRDFISPEGMIRPPVSTDEVEQNRGTEEAADGSLDSGILTSGFAAASLGSSEAVTDFWGDDADAFLFERPSGAARENSSKSKLTSMPRNRGRLDEVPANAQEIEEAKEEGLEEEEVRGEEDDAGNAVEEGGESGTVKKKKRRSKLVRWFKGERRDGNRL